MMAKFKVGDRVFVAQGVFGPSGDTTSFSVGYRDECGYATVTKAGGEHGCLDDGRRFRLADGLCIPSVAMFCVYASRDDYLKVKDERLEDVDQFLAWLSGGKGDE